MKLIKRFNDLVLSKRLIILMLLIGLLPLLAVGVTNIISARIAIYNAEFSLLENLKFSKKDQIEAYFEQIGNQISVLAENRTVVDAVKEFTTALDKLPSDLAIDEDKRSTYQQSVEQFLSSEFNRQYQTLNNQKAIDYRPLIPKDDATLAAQYLYISDNPNPLGSKDLLIEKSNVTDYSLIHGEYHPEFKRYLDKFHFYDIFLIDAQSGKVVYSVYKEIDFATSLIDGPFQNSGLAKIFRKASALEPNQPSAIVDFEYYQASYDKPASFIGSPIYENGKLLGVLVSQIPKSILNSILNKTQGMGETGEVYLVGKDKLMRSQSRFSQQDTVIKKQVDTLATQQVFNQDKDIHTMVNYRGREVISVYTPLNIVDLDWAIIADIETDEALAAIDTEILLNLVIGILSAIIVTFIASFFASTIAVPLNSAVNIAEKVSQGKLDNDIKVSTQCEVGTLLRALNKMQNNLKQRLEKDRKALAENTRIKQALDNISGNMLVVDVHNTIVYCNYAMSDFFEFAKNNIQTVNPKVDVSNIVGHFTLLDLLPHKSRSIQGKLLKESSDSAESVCHVQLGELELTLIANPVLNAHGERLGTVVEWKDRTLELATEKEVQIVVDKALKGDLTSRISLQNKEGFFANLSKSVNQLVAVSEGITGDILHVMEAMAHGDLNQQMDADYQGVYQQLKTNVNATCDKLREVVGQIQTSASFVKLGTSEISMANQDLNKRTEEQSASLQQTSTSMASINEKMQKNAALSQQASELVNQSRNTALEGGR